MRHPWVLVAVGVVLVGSATILGLFLFRTDGFFEITTGDLTIWSIVVGLQMGAFLMLLFVHMKEPSVERRTAFFLFGLFGAVCGLIAGVVYGIVGIDQVCGATGFGGIGCSWSVLGVGSVRLMFWPTFGLVVALGVILGTAGGVTAALLTRGWRAPTTAMLGA